MLEVLDVILFASRNGLVVSRSLVEEALAQIDIEAIRIEASSHYEAKVWDGKSAPPLGSTDRWLHGKDGSSRSAIEALEQDKGVVYFLFKDGALKCWQPHRADMPGRIHMVDNPSDANHWEKAAASHISRDVAIDTEVQVLRQALDTTLQLHEQRGIPYTVGTIKRGSSDTSAAAKT